MGQVAASAAGSSVLSRPRPGVADLDGLGVPHLLQRAAIGVEHFDPRLFNLSDEQLDTAFLPDSGVGRWPVRVLLGHLADAEMVFTNRMRRVVAEESPVFQVWDEQAFIDGGVYGAGVLRAGMPMPNIGGYVATIYTLRAWMCEWLSSLDEGCWSREGMHPEKGAQTLRRVCEYNAWHLEHHAWYLNAKVERFLGVAPVGEGCGAGCGCHGADGAPAGTAGSDPAASKPQSGEACGKPGCCKG